MEITKRTRAKHPKENDQQDLSKENGQQKKAAGKMSGTKWQPQNGRQKTDHKMGDRKWPTEKER